MTTILRLLLLTATLLLLGLDQTRAQESDQRGRIATISPITRRMGTTPLKLFGVVENLTETCVSCTVPGIVSEICVNEGVAVKAGQILLRLDPTEYQLEFECLRAEVAQAQAALAKAEQEKGPAARTVVDHAKAALVTAGARLELAKHRLECTKLKAPRDGIVLAINARLGEMVRPEFNQGGHAVNLCEIVNDRFMMVRVDLPAATIKRDISLTGSFFPDAAKCEVRFPGEPGISCPAALENFGRRLDKLGTVQSRIRFEAPRGRRVQVGELVEVIIPTHEQ